MPGDTLADLAGDKPYDPVKHGAVVQRVAGALPGSRIGPLAAALSQLDEVADRLRCMVRQQPHTHVPGSSLLDRRPEAGRPRYGGEGYVPGTTRPVIPGRAVKLPCRHTTGQARTVHFHTHRRFPAPRLSRRCTTACFAPVPSILAHVSETAFNDFPNGTLRSVRAKSVKATFKASGSAEAACARICLRRTSERSHGLAPTQRPPGCAARRYSDRPARDTLDAVARSAITANRM